MLCNTKKTTSREKDRDCIGLVEIHNPTRSSRSTDLGLVNLAKMAPSETPAESLPGHSGGPDRQAFRPCPPIQDVPGPRGHAIGPEQLVARSYCAIHCLSLAFSRLISVQSFQYDCSLTTLSVLLDNLKNSHVHSINKNRVYSDILSRSMEAYMSSINILAHSYKRCPTTDE